MPEAFFPAGEVTATTGAGNDYANTMVVDSYDLAIRTALDVAPGLYNFPDVEPQEIVHPGGSYVILRNEHFPESVVTAWKTPLNELQDVDPTALPAQTSVTLTPVERGAVIAVTRYLERRTLAPFSGYTAKELVSSALKTIDEVVQDKILAGITRVNQETAFDSDNLRKAFTSFTEQGVPGRYNVDTYVAVLHPRQIHDLRLETGPDGWREPKANVDSGLLRVGGVVGQWEGFVVYGNARVRKNNTTAAAPGYTGYLFGASALAKAIALPFSTVVGPPRDSLRRVHTLGWLVDSDYAVFEPKAIKAFLTTSSVTG